MKHNQVGLTIMDGPFCSIMPRGNNKDEFLLYHPKYSVVSESKKLIDISSQGTIAINRWTSNLNEILNYNNGHREYFSNLFHAAFPKSKLILYIYSLFLIKIFID